METTRPDKTGSKSFPTLVDPFGRPLDYLRLAVTDRCNLRCKYCMPSEGISLKPHESILTFEEMGHLVFILSKMGVSKVRLTGGEPMVRRGITEFIRQLRDSYGVQHIHLTSNGFWTPAQLEEIDSLHLSGINMSLDSLQPARFNEITRRDAFSQVWNTIELLIEKNIPLKLNMVVQAGVNDDEILNFAELARHHNIDVRFIEQMPFNGSTSQSHTITADEIHTKLTQTYGAMKEHTPRGSTASLFHVSGMQGRLGIIAGYSRTFCDSCNRLRITSEGQLKTCLYDGGALDLRKMLRQGATDIAIAEQIWCAILNRSMDGFEAEIKAGLSVKSSMASIGG